MSNKSEPAFPTDIQSVYSGMSLRDYFAAKAMAGYMFSVHPPEENGVALTGLITDEVLARISYKLADAMLLERAK